MVTLGSISGDSGAAQDQRDLVALLSSNGIPFGGQGSRVYEIDVPASKLGLALRLLQTNRLVIEHGFVFFTNRDEHNE